MNKYVAATLSIAIAIGPASAIDADVGGTVGGAGAGAGVSNKGASFGGEVSADGVGGGKVGGAVGTGNGAPSASGGTGDNLGGTSGSPSSGVAPAGSAGSIGNTNAAVPGAFSVAVPGALRPTIILPRHLGPTGRRDNPLLPKIVRKPGTPDAVVQVCQQAIFSAAKPLGAVGVQAASAGLVRRQRDGLTAPLSVRIDYGKEVRQAKVGCRVDAKGRVIGVT